MALVGAAEAGRRSGKSRRSKAERRRETVLALHATGLENLEIAKRLKVSLRTVQRDLEGLEGALERFDEALAGEPVTAGDLHLMLSDLLNLDIADVMNSDNTYKPVKDWPPLWRRLYVVPEVRAVFERSGDGGASSWDQVGTITKLSRMPDILKVIELAARLTAVGAIGSSTNSKEVAGEVCDEIARRISEGRKRAAQRCEYSASQESPRLITGNRDTDESTS